MKYYVLASGSKGNCSLIVSNETIIMLDCGCSKKYINDSLKELNYTLDDIDALLLTHSHADHIRSVDVFTQIPVYASFELLNRRDEIEVVPYQSFQIKDVNITPIALSHDTESTVGYIFDDGSERLVYVTDTGYVSEKNIEYLLNADYYIFESNHDIPTLMATRRPQFLKARIISNYGHLCNEEAAQILSRCIGANTKEIVLAHISQEANTQEMALNSLLHELHFIQYPVSKLKIYAAGQYEIIRGGN